MGLGVCVRPNADHFNVVEDLRRWQKRKKSKEEKEKRRRGKMRVNMRSGVKRLRCLSRHDQSAMGFVRTTSMDTIARSSRFFTGYLL